MDEYYVRVYHMKDGTTKEPYAVYALYEQAVMALDHFNPNGPKDDTRSTPEEDMEDVSYVTIEKHYVPKGRCWSAEESEHHSIKRTQSLLEYLDRLGTLKGHGHHVTQEIQDTLKAISDELGLAPRASSCMHSV